MLTIAITHKIHKQNVSPFTLDELDQLLSENRIALGTNWRGRDEQEWANNERARSEFDLFDLLAAQGGFVVANYQGLPPQTRVIGRVKPTGTGRPEMWHQLRTIHLGEAIQVNTLAYGIDDLQVLPGRSIVDITQRAGDRVSRLLDKS